MEHNEKGRHTNRRVLIRIQILLRQEPLLSNHHALSRLTQ